MDLNPEQKMRAFMPFDLVVFLSFFSPIILAACLLWLSFVNSNLKGFVYIGILLFHCMIRNFIYMFYGNPESFMNPMCNVVQYSYGNSSFSAFVFSFTIAYLILPMFLKGDINYFVFSGLTTSFAVDMAIKLYGGCLPNISDVIINSFIGGVCGAGVVVMMNTIGTSRFLFFNELSSNKESCSVAKNQTFKCSVYKNGELIS